MNHIDTQHVYEPHSDLKPYNIFMTYAVTESLTTLDEVHTCTYLPTVQPYNIFMNHIVT